MQKTCLRVLMLDRFSIIMGDKFIVENDKGPKKPWLLLAYILCKQGKTVSQRELIHQLWGNKELANPVSVLKTTLYRARQLLEQLSPEHGRDMIVHKDNGYIWNEKYPVELDFDEFEQLCGEAYSESDPSLKKALFRRAFTLYKSDFLAIYSYETWVTTLSAYYKNLYFDAVIEFLSLIDREDEAPEAIALCTEAMKEDPYNEELCYHLMRTLMLRHDYHRADSVYEDMQEKLFNSLGVQPSEELRQIHAECLKCIEGDRLTSEQLREQLLEIDPSPGPLFCSFSVFKQFYHVEARSVSRRGDAIHIALLSISSDSDDDALRVQNMELMKATLQKSLRRGDVVAQCSGTQYALLLQANFENSNMVCNRIERAFRREYPHNYIHIRHSVLPLEPLNSGGGSASNSFIRRNFS